ncbi:hypothetical protein DPMN_012237 [Dreissena polymorpha]|uniref:Uncharacterized protein n=1 Tax=Dreissena polymorpha TaxID=45954 RepID=A0A9D4N5G7_DREPO|nr:hypothetical protein DPMN_012237 [Dreissena polymorpha]
MLAICCLRTTSRQQYNNMQSPNHIRQQASNMLSPYHTHAASQQYAVSEQHPGSKPAIYCLRTTSRQQASNMLSPNYIKAASQQYLSPNHIQTASHQYAVSEEHPCSRPAYAVSEPHTCTKPAMCCLRTTSRQHARNIFSPNHMQAAS